MEWKWVKTLLIILFLILDCFLAYRVYLKNTVSVMNSEAVESTKVILASKNIKCDFELTDVEMKKYMKKLNISNEKNIEEKFIPMSSVNAGNTEYTGRNREIISLPSIMVNFIRESRVENVCVSEIVLGYYPEINVIDKNILSGEATPAWKITLDTGEEYIYNAYLGDRVNVKELSSRI